MNRVHKTGRMFFSIFVVALVLGIIGFVACGGGDSKPAGESQAASSQKTDQASPAEKASAGSKAKTPAGWQTARHEEWSVSFPGDWNSDPDTGIWQPGEVGPFMGRPDVSVFMGGIPVMPPANFEERVKTHINADPQESVKVSIAGFSGIKCSWEQMGKKHQGIFLEEKIGAGMIVIHFFDCQAPSAEFDQYKADFEKILASVRI